MKVLITAGATRNPVDAIRYLSAHASGGTGVFVGRALVARGHEVHLMGSHEARLRGPELPGEEFFGTRDLMARMEAWVRANPDGAVVHSSAVGDYEVAAPNASKTPSGMERWSIELVRAPKIADQVRGWGLRGAYVTFKAAAPETTDEALVEIARRQRARVGCDAVFANVLGRTGAGVWWVTHEAIRFERREDAVSCLIEAVSGPVGGPGW